MNRYIYVLLVICFFLVSCNEPVAIGNFPSTMSNTQKPVSTETLSPTQEPSLTLEQFHETQASTSTPWPTPTPESEYYLGDTVLQKGYGLTAISINDPYYTNLLRLTDPAKKHIAIDVILTNYSGPPFTFNNLTLYGYIRDIEGYVYPMIHQGTYDPEIRNLVIDIGEQLSQRMVFEVSKDSVPILLELYVQPINFTSDVKIYTNLRTPPDNHESLQIPISNMSVNLMNLPPIGTSVEKLGISLTILDVNPDNRQLFRSGYKFVAVNLELENIAKIDRIGVNREDFFLIDDGGYIYPASEGVSDEIPEIVLDIGGKTKGWVVFGIPPEANPYGIKYSVDQESNNYIYAGLLN